MSFFQTRYKKEKRWICLHCKRINDPEDQACAFCREARPSKTKEKEEGGTPRYSVAKRTDYNGRWYHSGFEAQYAAQLDWRKKAGEILEWKPQHKIEIKINGKKWRNYMIDFRIVLKNGTIQYIECKGYATQEWKMKWDVLNIVKNEILEPGAELILVNQ